MKTLRNIVLSFFALITFVAGGLYLSYKICPNFANGYMNPKVSIIIPVYNTEKYLDGCLDSVLNQTYNNLEIVCINDGSTDNSLKILENYKEKDKRVKVISQENKGIAQTRNIGLENITGDYVLFIDSDDFFSKKLVELLVKDINDYKNVDIVEFKHVMFNDGEEFSFEKDLKDWQESIVYNERKPNEDPYKVLGVARCMSWNKFYKTSFIKDNNLHFKNGLKYGEDLLFNYFAIPCMKSAVLHKSKDMVYVYRKKRQGSISTEMKAEEEMISRFEICDELIKNKNKINFENSNTWIIRILVSLIKTRFGNVQDDSAKKNYAEKFLKMIDKFQENNKDAILDEESKNYIENMRKTYCMNN